jgi:tetratricopeptide (TPR) repeat protein
VIRVINVFSQPGRSFLTPHLESSPTPALDTIIDISHESLIRQWDTLKNWVIDEAKSADIYLRLEETARLYRAKNADPYRGLDLQAALEWRKTERPTDAWAKRYGAKGKETEAFKGAIAFLDESVKNRDKEQASQERRWRITFISVCAVMVVSMIAAFYIGWLWQTAEAEQNKAVALKLAAEGQLAENRHSNQLQLHALLAIESTKRFPSSLANQSLRHALELMPRPLTTMLHQDSVSAVSFNPDGKTLASGSVDNTVRVWDRATGKELQRLSHEDTVNDVSFSPDGKTLASGSRDKTVRLWLWQPQDLIAAACERSTRNLKWNEWRLYFEDVAYGKTCERLPVHESVIKHAQQLAKAGNLSEALVLFKRISEIEPSATLDPIAEAERWERKGKLEKILASADKLREEKQYAEWIEMAGEAFELDPDAIAHDTWNDVCWDGALDGQALAVMHACDRAVERADDDQIHYFRNSRGLARALTGNTQGAIEDFKFFIQHTDNAEQKSQRQAWVGALKAGTNPFTPKLLQSLRGQ